MALIPVDISVFTNPRSFYRASVSPFSSSLPIYHRSIKHFKPSRFLNPTPNQLFSKNLKNRHPLNFQGILRCGSFDEISEFVEVIGIGNRSDSILDFCVHSPLQSFSSLRFWRFAFDESVEWQLEQISIRNDHIPKRLEVSEFLQSCSKTIILVASAGYGSECTSALDILRVVNSMHGFVISINLNPFSFEGKRRQNEVKDLQQKLKLHSNFCIDIDMDKLLDNDLVTLDEALKTANNAVLLAINAISVLKCKENKKLIEFQRNNLAEVNISEVTQMLKGYNVARVGFGAGSDVKSSLAHALYECPFLGTGVKDLNGIVICILMSSDSWSDSDICSFLHIFRQTTEFAREIMVSAVHEPELEDGLLLTTLVTVGTVREQTSENNGIVSRLAHHFPFVFDLFNQRHMFTDKTRGNHRHADAHSTKLIDSSASWNTENRIDVEPPSGSLDGLLQQDEVQSYSKSFALRNHNNGDERKAEDLLAFNAESSNFHEQCSEGFPTFQKRDLISHYVGPGYQIAQEWAKRRRAVDSRNTPSHNSPTVFCLPVGIIRSVETKESAYVTHAAQHHQTRLDEDMKACPPRTSSWNDFSEAGFAVAKDFYTSSSSTLKGKYGESMKKHRFLSARAASMLEAERDSQRVWSRIVEMQYRGGVYRGHCQGGLPEGKGCLISGDGSIYDGMWHYGNRSGIGAFYYSNGDVFQGSWRDDVIHGKGWYYFHTGDRWFVNFWKGKASGEGRFYSKSGGVFFGHFQDGLRHGDFLCIDGCGARSMETWDVGVLLNRRELDC